MNVLNLRLFQNPNLIFSFYSTLTENLPILIIITTSELIIIKNSGNTKKVFKSIKILRKQDQILQKIAAASPFQEYFEKHEHDGMVPFNIQ